MDTEGEGQRYRFSGDRPDSGSPRSSARNWNGSAGRTGNSNRPTNSSSWPRLFREGTRPATPLIVGFIDHYRQMYGVESICSTVLTEHGVTIAPRTYRKARCRPPSDRDLADAYLEHALRELAGQPEEIYGRQK